MRYTVQNHGSMSRQKASRHLQFQIPTAMVPAGSLLIQLGAYSSEETAP